jgi:hypothetical protein
MKDILKIWPLILNIEETKKIDETYFFNFKDKKEESCALEIKQGKCKFIDQEPDSFTMKVSVTTSDFVTILSQQQAYKKAISEGKVIVEGDDKNLEKFQKFFSGEPKGREQIPNSFHITENEKEIEEGKWTKPKKVLILTASPRKDRGNTWTILSPFKQGLEESGCEIDIVHIADLENKRCKGCFTCWFGKKKCVYKDDVADLVHKFHTYDLMIIAAPVYVDGLPGAFKNLIDRTIAILDPEFIIKDNHCRHPIRYPRMPHLVLLSTIGFTEMDNFHPMVEHVKEICKNMHLTYIGEILHPTAWMLLLPNIRPLYNGVFAALKQAAIEIINSGKIPEKIQKTIETPIFSHEQITAIHNRTN